MTSDLRAAISDSVSAALERFYVFPDAAKRMAARLDSSRKAGAFETLSAPEAFATALTRELRRAQDDTHLRIAFDPEEAARAANPSEERRVDIARERKANFHFEQARILPGNVGYLEFTQFADTSAEARATVRAAMQFVAHGDALILDLRDNRGGSAAMAGEIASYFVKDREHWSDTYNRLTDAWTENWVENRARITGGIFLDMPLTVLVSSWTYSAAEGLAYALKYQRHARVVGQPSAGGAHIVRRVPLGNGFLGFIPYIRSVNVSSKSDWEGTGVAPDLSVDAPDALLRAQEAIAEERIASSPDSQAVRASTFALNQARAAARLVDLSALELSEFAGRFEEYAFTVRDARLYSQNRSRNGKLDRLAPITSTLFSIDRESQVEFLRDGAGVVSSIRIYWNDGWVDTIARSE